MSFKPENMGVWGEKDFWCQDLLPVPDNPLPTLRVIYRPYQKQKLLVIFWTTVSSVWSIQAEKTSVGCQQGKQLSRRSSPFSEALEPLPDPWKLLPQDPGDPSSPRFVPLGGHWVCVPLRVAASCEQSALPYSAPHGRGPLGPAPCVFSFLFSK